VELFDRERFRFGMPVALDDRAANAVHRDGSVRDDPAGYLATPIHELLGRHDMVEEAEPQRFLGVDQIAGQQQLDRLGPRHLPRQSNRRSAGGKERPLHLLQSELRTRHGHANVGAHDQLHAAGNRVAVDRRDDGFDLVARNEKKTFAAADQL
jgi:hypothetical protein